MSSVSNIQNQAFVFSNTTNEKQINLGSQDITIIADNTLLGNTILNGSGITNSISGLTCSFDNITKLPLLETALFAVNQPPDNSTLSVNSKLYLTNTNPPTAPTKTITIDASNLLIEYESVINQNLILQSSTSSSLIYRQTDATTKELILNPAGISLTDTDDNSNYTSLTNLTISINNSGTKTATLDGESLYIVNGIETMLLGNGGMFFNNVNWKIGDMLNAGIGGTEQTLEMAAEDITITSGFDLKLNSGTQIAIDRDCPKLYFPNTNGLVTDFVSITNTGTITTKNATKTTTITPDGIQGGVYHTDQPTTAQTYYLSFVQSGGVSGYYLPCFDSATLTYSPSSNLLLVNGLQLSSITNAITSYTAGGYLTIEGNSASNREFNFPITADMNGLTISNRRTNGVYKVMITNSSGAPRTINSSLSTISSQPNKTSYSTSIIDVGDTWIMTIKVQNFAGTLYNCVSLEKFI